LNLAGHILCLPEERPATVAMNWELVSVKDEEDGDHIRHGRPSRKIKK